MSRIENLKKKTKRLLRIHFLKSLSPNSERFSSLPATAVHETKYIIHIYNIQYTYHNNIRVYTKKLDFGNTITNDVERKELKSHPASIHYSQMR